MRELFAGLGRILGMWGLTRAERLLDLVFPRACLGCRDDLPPPLSGPLCGACLARLRPLGGPLCARCGRPWGRPGLCWDCGSALRSLDLTRAAFPYRRPLVEMIHAFKYRGDLDAGRALGDWMAGLCVRHPELRLPDMVAPVPLHRSRLRERGFNQAALLARPVARTLRLPVVEALRRDRNTPPQWRFRRGERVARLREAFSARPGLRLAGKSVLLVDDVCTTGGTLEGCARALRNAGAAWVGAYVAARG